MNKLYYIMLFLLLLTSCKQIQYIPVETVKTEYRDKILRDSVYLRDSVFVKVARDTVYIEKHRYLYRYKTERDSVIIRDSIPVLYPVKGDTIVVEKRGFFWWTGLGAIVMLVSLLIYKLRRVLK